MRLIVTGDLQATDGSEQSYLNPTKTLQHCRVEKYFDDIARIYKEYKCEGMIDLGDTTNDRSQIPINTIDVLGKGLAKIPSSDFNFKLTGNHEQFLRNSSITNRKLFEHKFEVIDDNEVFEFGQYMAFFCSYTNDFNALSNWILEGLKEYRKQPKILFGHFEVIGARMNSGTALQGVPLELLKPFKLCMLGHIHIPQTIGECIHYVGSPFQQDWGEAGESKRVGILNTDNMSVEWVPMEGYPTYENINFAQFKKVALKESDNRYRVKLVSHSETEEFFKHPMFHRAEPVYDYDTEEAKADKPETTDWSFDGIMQHYMQVVPPSSVGMDIDPVDLLDLGKSIAAGNV